MDHLQKVVWSEGMFLTPHHFQQWDRHIEDLLVRSRRIGEPRGWGLTELKVNEDSLANGEFIQPFDQYPRALLSTVINPIVTVGRHSQLA